MKSVFYEHQQYPMYGFEDVDGLERYLMYGLGWWMDRKGARITSAATCLVWNNMLTNQEGSREVSCRMCGTGMAIPMRPYGARGTL
jgi:hypothetical protein